MLKQLIGQGRRFVAIPRCLAWLFLYGVLQTVVASPVVQGADGGGYEGITINQQSTEAFLGIPYAVPPVGALRFNSPQAIASPRAVMTAKQFKPACMQAAKIPESIGMSEDCLYLNVYRPAVQNEAELLPVIVFIHGGRYWTGRSSENHVERLAEVANAVVVTVAYRLNAFGFYTNAASVLQGAVNVGLQDQQQSLRWIQDHIAAFGGDPQRVTLAGESAGGGSVLMHLLMPTSGPLFKQAILQSPWQWRLPFYSEAQEHGVAFAAQHGCSGTAEQQLQCLRQVEASQLVPSLGQSDYFQPVVGVEGLSKQPLLLLEEGAYHRDKALMLGLNATEGHFMATSRTGWKTPTDEVTEATYRHTVQAALSPFYTEAQIAQIVNWYEPLASQHGYWLATSHILGDFYLNCGTYSAAKAVYLKTTAPVFSYWFDHVSAHDPKPYLGPTHGNELSFLFESFVYPPGHEFTKQDQRLSLAMMRSWGAFAQQGNPRYVGAQWQWLPSSETMGMMQAQVLSALGPSQYRVFEDERGLCVNWQPLLSQQSAE